MPTESVKIPTIDTSGEGAPEALATLRAKLTPQGDVVSEAGRQRTIDTFGEPLSPIGVVERICRDVREQGLPAVLDYTKKLDRADLSPAELRVTAEELVTAHSAAEPEFLETIRRIRDNILRFQTAILHKDVNVPWGDGFLRQRYTPLRRIGVCVPGGAAAYPSTVLMSAVPAQAAGVQEIVIVAPPTPFGSYNQDLLATCHELGIREVYRVGGAQGVAAMAYGVEGLPQADKIVGPGNMCGALAKKHVYGEVDIDSIAGPSEVIVLADETAKPSYIAADLIAQAEHSPGSGVLITWSREVLEQTKTALDEQLAQLERGDLARQSLEEFGALVLVPSPVEAVTLTNQFAPEHLHVATANPGELAPELVNAGAVFLGHDSPVAIGDYAAGPSHVLPTSGTARFASGLSSNDFLRSSSLIHATRAELTSIADDVRTLADKEGLTAHRASVDVRFEDDSR